MGTICEWCTECFGIFHQTKVHNVVCVKQGKCTIVLHCTRTQFGTWCAWCVRHAGQPKIQIRNLLLIKWLPIQPLAMTIFFFCSFSFLVHNPHSNVGSNYVHFYFHRFAQIFLFNDTKDSGSIISVNASDITTFHTQNFTWTREDFNASAAEVEVTMVGVNATLFGDGKIQMRVSANFDFDFVLVVKLMPFSCSFHAVKMLWQRRSRRWFSAFVAFDKCHANRFWISGFDQ